MNLVKLAVFISGRGSNFINLYKKEKEYSYTVSLVVVSNPNAGVIPFLKEKNIPYILLNKQEFTTNQSLLKQLKEYQVDMIVLAGFLWKIPPYLIESYPDRIINIHPALLPKYGGKGMYGLNIHKAVLANNENESGVSIHLVNEEYDKGAMLLQEKIDIKAIKNANDLATQVLKLEHLLYPKAIHDYCLQKFKYN